MRNILITGSCGFIFGNFIRKVIHDQSQKPDRDKFISIDRVTSNATNSMYWNKDHTFYPADIRDEHIMDIIFQREQPDIVIHGAAEACVDASIKDGNSFVTSNVLGTQVLINCCVKHGVKKFIYISTDEIYGHLTDENAPAWTEEAPIAPRNPYSATKAAGELMVRSAASTHGLTYNITRSSNNYGPRQTPDKLVPRAIKSILEGQKIPVWGQGLQVRDWTYVGDNCAAIMTVLEKGAPNEIYNISANHELTNIETIQAVCNAMGGGHNLIEFVEDPRPGHDFRYSLDTTKIKTLGWKPTFKFKEAMKHTCDWYKMNQWFLK